MFVVSPSPSLVIFLIVPVVSFCCCARFVLIRLVSLLKVYEEGAMEWGGGSGVGGQRRFTAGLHSIYQDFNSSSTP